MPFAPFPKTALATVRTGATRTQTLTTLTEQSAFLLRPGRRRGGPSWDPATDVAAIDALPRIPAHASVVVVRRLLLWACMRAFSALPPEEQQLLMAIDVAGETYDGYATRTGTPRSWLPALVFRARTRLDREFVASLTTFDA